MAKTDGSDVALAKRDEKKAPPTIFSTLKQNAVEFSHALPATLDTDRFVRVVMTALRQNPQLQRCSTHSILAGAMTAAQLGLELNTPLGHAYLIPYNDKRRGLEAQFQLGYQGLLDLAWRSGQYRTIFAQKVYEDDAFRYSYGLNPQLKHIPADMPKGEPTHYYAVYRLANGGENFVVMSRQAVEEHAKRYSQAFRSGKGSPWQTDFDTMALKTVLKMLLKYAPKSVEIAKAFAADETVKHEVGDDMSSIPPVEIMDSEVVEEEPVSFDPETGEILSEDEIQAAFDAAQVSMEETPGE